MTSPRVAPARPLDVPEAPESETRIRAHGERPVQNRSGRTESSEDYGGPTPPGQRAVHLDRADYERLLPMVRRTAMRLARKVPSHITVGDLIGYGWVGLMEAFQRARADMPAEEFEAYASYRVRGAMLDYLRTLDPATRDVRRASKQLTETIRALTAESGNAPEEAAIAAALNLPIDDYHAMLERISRSGSRLDVLDVDQVDIPTDALSIDEEVGRRELGGVVATALEALPAKLQRIVALYYQEDRTLREIGRMLGVTESRVCQLHSEAMHRIRSQVGDQR